MAKESRQHGALAILSLPVWRNRCIVSGALNIQESSGQKYTVYCLTVASNAGAMWTVHKRYSDFEQLHASLGKAAAGHLPVKKFLSKTGERVVKERMEGLNSYIQATLANPETAWAPFVGAFLAQDQVLVSAAYVSQSWSAEWAPDFIEQIARWKAMRGRRIEDNAEAKDSWRQEKEDMQATIDALREEVDMLRQEKEIVASDRETDLIAEVNQLRTEKEREAIEKQHRETSLQAQVELMQRQFQEMLGSKDLEVQHLHQSLRDAHCAPAPKVEVVYQPPPIQVNQPQPPAPEEVHHHHHHQHQLPPQAPPKRVATSVPPPTKVLSTKERVLKAKADRVAKEYEDRVKELALANQEISVVMHEANMRAKGEFEVTRRGSAASDEEQQVPAVAPAYQPQQQQWQQKSQHARKIPLVASGGPNILRAP